MEKHQVQHNSQSSIVLKRGAKGDYSWEIKVYDNDLDAAADKVAEMDDRLKQIYLKEE